MICSHPKKREKMIRKKKKERKMQREIFKSPISLPPLEFELPGVPKISSVQPSKGKEGLERTKHKKALSLGTKRDQDIG